MSELITFEDYEQSANDPEVIVIDNVDEVQYVTARPKSNFGWWVGAAFVIGSLLYALKG